jgi:glycosyltransferase involved in cell wall biosynthesis
MARQRDKDRPERSCPAGGVQSSLRDRQGQDVTMKVVIKAASVKMGGALTYLCDLLRHVVTMDPNCEYVVFLPSETIHKLPPLPRSVRLVGVPVKGMNPLARLWWEQVSLRKLLTEEKPDLFYAMGNLGMFRCPVRQLLLVEGLLYFSKIYQRSMVPKHSFSWRVAYTLRRWLICRSVQGADVVMVPTQATLDELRDFVDVAPHKAVVNPYGINPPEALSSDHGLRAKADERNGGSPCRLLYVSLYGEHKNLSTLLKAMPVLNGKGTGRFLLQTTADPAWEGATWTVTHAEDIGLARQPGISPWVRSVGPLSREQTENLYRNSDIFVFPSLTESFGFPMAEAMSHSLPIVASDTPVNREICGEAAVYFSPLDPHDLASQVQRVAADGALRQQLSARGRQRARERFRWTTHVQRVLDIASPLAHTAIEEQEPAPCVQ